MLAMGTILLQKKLAKRKSKQLAHTMLDEGRKWASISKVSYKNNSGKDIGNNW
jgi:hypothetical protein